MIRPGKRSDTAMSGAYQNRLHSIYLEDKDSGKQIRTGETGGVYESIQNAEKLVS